MRRLFDENDRYTSEALRIGEWVQDALGPIFREYMGCGYSARELSHIVMLAAFDCEVMAVLDKRGPESEGANEANRDQ